MSPRPWATFASLCVISTVFSLVAGCGGSTDPTNPPAPAAATVTATAGSNGAIAPSGASTVTSGQTKSFTVTANSGYDIATVTGCGGSLSGSTYTTGAITDACTVTASFGATAPITYTVTATAGSNGTIAPSGASTVISGQTKSFTVTANSGYDIATVTGCGGSLSGSTYTTGAIIGACTVTASFNTSAVITDSTTGMLLLKVPGGTYTMGDTFGDGANDELPTHQVTVGEFYIGKYEVTQGQWQAVMGSNPSTYSACGANCPVESVNWDDIQTFITTLNQQSGKSYRLPTEAEWEYAARSGGQSHEYSGGSDINAVAWYIGNSGGTTHPVGQKQANGLGLYDMSGNVDEFVSDWFTLSYNSAVQTNPTGPATGSLHTYRGGSWFEDSFYERASYRDAVIPNDPGYPTSRYPNIGFRLAAPSPAP